MGELEHNAAFWRAKAEEARAVMDSLQSEQAKQHMLSVAKSDDRLAEMAEREPPKLHVITSDRS